MFFVYEGSRYFSVFSNFTSVEYNLTPSIDDIVVVINEVSFSVNSFTVLVRKSAIFRVDDKVAVFIYVELTKDVLEFKVRDVPEAISIDLLLFFVNAAL